MLLIISKKKWNALLHEEMRFFNEIAWKYFKFKIKKK